MISIILPRDFTFKHIYSGIYLEFYYKCDDNVIVRIDYPNDSLNSQETIKTLSPMRFVTLRRHLNVLSNHRISVF